MSHYTTIAKQRVAISQDDARERIVAATVFRNPDELCCYSRVAGMLYREYSLPVPDGADEMSEESLLEYARRNMPEELHFGYNGKF